MPVWSEGRHLKLNGVKSTFIPQNVDRKTNQQNWGEPETARQYRAKGETEERVRGEKAD